MGRFEKIIILNLKSPLIILDDFYESILSKYYFKIWKEVNCIFSYFEYNSRIGTIKIEIDWREAIKIIREEPHKDIILECKISAPKNDNKINLDNLLNYHFEIFLYNFFLAMNISYPGSCNLLNTYYNKKYKDLETPVGLDTTYLQISLTNSLNIKWPKIKYIPLSDTWRWLQNLDIGVRQVAISRAEKALFALLHICKIDRISPDILIWQAHALEALYDTPITLINKFLKDRILLVLDTPKTHKKNISRNIQNFYKLRSAFVHGELDIAHPSDNEVLDRNIDKLRNNLMDSIIFATGIMVATIQKMIFKGWRQIDFKETYFGINSFKNKY